MSEHQEIYFLIYGAKGWIGGQVVSILDKRNIKYHLSNLRVDDTLKLEEEILSIGPSHIISTIGRTHGNYQGVEYPTIDYLEQPGKAYENVRDNLYSPLTLAILSHRYNIHYTYLGTGCIFDYDDSHPKGNSETGYNEDDVPNFIGSSYSIVKGFTDRLMHLYPDVLNIRIRMPIIDGKNRRDFIAKIMKYKKICNMPNSMSVLSTLIPVMVDMALKKRTGTINLTNPGLISHNQILEMYRDIVDPNFTWQNFSIEEQDQILDSKRSNNCLDTTHLESLYPEIPDIKIAVNEVIKNMDNK